MIGEDFAGDALMVDAGADETEPSVGDLRLKVAMVPGEAVGFGRARRQRRAGGRLAGGEQEEVWIAKQDEGRRAVRVGGDHAQETLLLLVGKPRGDRNIGVNDWIKGRQRRDVVLELPGDRGHLGRIADDVIGRRRIRVDGERRRIPGLGGQQPAQIGIELAEALVGERG